MAELRFIETEQGLCLTDGERTVRADFSEMLPRLRRGNLGQELLVRAAKLKDSPSPVVWDATAGLGEDSLLLAAAGYRVVLFERDSVIAALLKDALRRAKELPELEKTAERMILVEGDSISYMNALPGPEFPDGGQPQAPQLKPPDIVFLDPMFPERKKSALVKKKFQLLQQLESPCADEKELLRAAFHARPAKIVIKRPLKGPNLAGVRPDYSLTGKAIRYDCILPASRREML